MTDDAGPGVDWAALERDLLALRAEMEAAIGPEDFEHFRSIERGGRLCTALGYATAWVMPNPLSAALLEPGPRVALVGGEERGSWMLDHQMASSRSFAFAALLTLEPAGAIARVSFTPGSTQDDRCPALENFTQALAGRCPLAWHGAGGTWALDWL